MLKLWIETAKEADKERIKALINTLPASLVEKVNSYCITNKYKYLKHFSYYLKVVQELKKKIAEEKALVNDSKDTEDYEDMLEEFVYFKEITEEEIKKTVTLGLKALSKEKTNIIQKNIKLF